MMASKQNKISFSNVKSDASYDFRWIFFSFRPQFPWCKIKSLTTWECNPLQFHFRRSLGEIDQDVYWVLEVEKWKVRRPNYEKRSKSREREIFEIYLKILVELQLRSKHCEKQWGYHIEPSRYGAYGARFSNDGCQHIGNKGKSEIKGRTAGKQKVLCLGFFLQNSIIVFFTES